MFFFLSLRWVYTFYSTDETLSLSLCVFLPKTEHQMLSTADIQYFFGFGLLRVPNECFFDTILILSLWWMFS